jgi:hypothetical protein
VGIRIFGIASSTNPAEDFRLAAAGLFAAVSALQNRPGMLTTPVLTGTGSFTATVGPSSALVDGTSNSLQGSYWVAIDAPVTVNIPAASPSARIDLISLQIQDDAYDASGFQRGRLTVTAGTPGSGVAPATPANSVPMWTVPVGASASSVAFTSAAPVFLYTAATGGIIAVRSASDKPAVSAGVQHRYRLDVAPGGSSALESSTDGITYTPVYDATIVPPAVYTAIHAVINSGYGAWTDVTLASGWAAFSGLTPQYRTAPGNKIEYRGILQATATFSGGTTIFTALGGAPSTVRKVAVTFMGATGYTNPGDIAFVGGGGVLNLTGSVPVPTSTILSLDGISISA